MNIMKPNHVLEKNRSIFSDQSGVLIILAATAYIHIPQTHARTDEGWRKPSETAAVRGGSVRGHQ